MDRFLIRKGQEPEEEPSSSKRLKLESESLSRAGSEDKPRGSTNGEICSYGEKCYRRNVHHFREYRHPHLERLLEQFEATGELPAVENPAEKELFLQQIQAVKKFGQHLRSNNEDVSSVDPRRENKPGVNTGNHVPDVQTEETDPESKGSSVTHDLDPYEKWKRSKPFNLFLTSIGPERTYFSISFVDLFHPSFGVVRSICHINFMIEASWLMDQIIQSSMWGKSTTIIYGTENPGIEELVNQHDWVQSSRVKSPHTFGHHHSKMSFIEYEDGSLRFIVYTANLIEADWLNKTQGVWISPKCSRINADEKQTGESPTGFRNDVLSYLVTYQLKQLEAWMSRIRHADCSKIKVVFIASAPNLSQALGDHGFKWGVKKVEQVLRKHLTAPVTPQWPIIAQCSSIGSLGPDDSWLKGEWGLLMEGPSKSRPPIKLVYPSVSDVRNSAEGEDGADCLPYGNATHSKQKWLEKFMWTYALPHIKTYCRVSPDDKEMAWFILTSANLSKAAWGKLNKKRDQLLVMSWECGVMFLPKFLTGESVFKGSVKSIDNGSRASSRIAAERKTVVYDFPIPYDLPVAPYTGANKPWLVDYLSHPRRR